MVPANTDRLVRLLSRSSLRIFVQEERLRTCVVRGRGRTVGLLVLSGLPRKGCYYALTAAAADDLAIDLTRSWRVPLLAGLLV